MRTVVSAEEMRWCDEAATRSYLIPSLLLMENAGAGVARLLMERFSPLSEKTILILCGKGNNAGDGFVAARHLFNERTTLLVMLLNSAGDLKGDAKTNFEILKALAKTSDGRLRIEQYSQRLLSGDPHADLIVDAIFGTGFKGSVTKPHSTVIEWMNNQSAPVIAVDIPSGINGTTGMKEGIAVQAKLTAALGALKTGLICNAGRDVAGEIVVVDIGIPNAVYAHQSLRTRMVEARDVQTLLPARRSTAHKYNVGKVFILAGSKGLTGAAALTAQACLRSGAGAVVVGTPETVYPILAKKLSETIVRPLPATSDGSLSLDGMGEIKERISWADVTVIGPGLSQQTDTQKLVQQLVMQSDARILIDADGLNALSAVGPRTLKKSKATLLLTPHAGEFSRLTGLSSREIEANRISSVRDAAKDLGSTVVLKGAPTVTGTTAGDVFLNPTGNPGMATVGSGDVLSGIIAGLWAQGMETVGAAFSGVYLHGLAGDLGGSKYGERSLVAQDLIDFLPDAFQKLKVSI